MQVSLQSPRSAFQWQKSFANGIFANNSSIGNGGFFPTIMGTLPQAKKYTNTWTPIRKNPEKNRTSLTVAGYKIIPQ